MKMRKTFAILLSLIMLIGLMPAFTVSLAADIADLAFTLNEDGEAYSLSACNLSATGVLVIPDTYNLKPVTLIDDNAFYNCSGLTSVTIPDTVTGIGDYAFFGCTGLVSIIISDTVTGIGEHAFRGCVGLTGVTIPNSVKRIGDSAFEGCENLGTINISDCDVSIGKLAFNNTAWYNSKPDGLVYIGSIAYSYMGSMPDGASITIAAGTKGIADYAFYADSVVTEVTIPDSVISIGVSAFSGCTQLESVTIPDSVINIGKEAFDSCINLENITLYDSVRSIGYGAFNNTPWYDNQPDGLVYAGKVLYAYKGTMPQDSSVVIADGTKSVSDYAFRDYSELERVTIHGSVTSIGNGAFLNCDNLTIYCMSGSAAESYAIINSITYVAIAGITSDTLSVATGIISGLNCGDSVEATLAKLGSSENVKVFDLNGNEVPDAAAKLGTGMTLKMYFYNGGAVADEVTVSVLGDTDGDGNTSTTDARMALRVAARLDDFNAAQISAAEVDGDANGISTSDARKLLRVAAKLDTL